MNWSKEMRLAQMETNLVKHLGAVENKTKYYWKIKNALYIFVLQMLLEYASNLVPCVCSYEIDVYSCTQFKNCTSCSESFGVIHVECPGTVFIQLYPETKSIFIRGFKGTDKELNGVPDGEIYVQGLRLTDCRLTGLDTISTKFNTTNLKELWIDNRIPEWFPEGVFKKLSHLQSLRFYYNELSIIRDKHFIGLSQLKSLDLSYNSISQIDGNAFSNLINLIDISLKSNRLKNVSSNVFKSNSELKNINLAYNPQLVIPDYLFANLRNLKSIKMSHSGLENIFPHTFENCSNLINLEMQNNEFVNLSPGLFQTLTKLITLNVGYNKLQSVHDSLFSALESLEELNLEGNQFSIINSFTFVQSSLKKLKILNLRRNGIVHIHNDAFLNLPNLVELDLSHNQWKEERNNFVSSNHLFELEQLNLSNNNISFFDLPNIFWQLRKLKKLDLSYNVLKEISVSLNVSYCDGVIINLSHNDISHFSFVEVVPRFFSGITNIQIHETILVDLSNNPLICDCRNYDLYQYLIGTTSTDRLLQTLFDVKVNYKQCLYLKFTNISEANCEDKSNCPVNCRCFWRPYHETFVVNCSYRNFVIPPTLSINHQRLEIILTGNSLTTGPTEDAGYENVTVLNLSNNKLISFDWCPPYIEKVNLSHNYLKMLNSEVLNTLNSSINFSNLTLEHNPWVCNCSALELQNFVQAHHQNVDTNEILCGDDQTALLKRNDLCKSKSIESEFPMAPVLSILTILLLISIVIAFYLRFEREIKIWLYSKKWCLWIVTEEELDRDEKYDIFLCFSHKDDNFVIENLMPTLEKSFKLCIHCKDWLPGEWINHQIVSSVYQSRRTVVVLSNDFLESAWGKLEFLTAHQRSMEEGRPRLIVIKLGELNMDKMDDDFKAYIKTNTYVEWGDPWFWKKLVYSLPHSANSADIFSEICDFQYDEPPIQT